MTINPNDPAFPLLDLAGRKMTTSLTKREYFAAQLFPAFVRNPDYAESSWHEIAEQTLYAVDALISELNKQ